MSDQLVKVAQTYGKIIPMIDGGTEEWTGIVRVIYPIRTTCLECMHDMLTTKRSTFHDCTLARKPRRPEHCVEYAHKLAWKDPEINTEFLSQEFDVDNEEHISWITKIALEHAKKYDLKFEIDDKFSRKVIKNTIAAIASTQAYIASMCCTEAIKVLSDCAAFLDNKSSDDPKARIQDSVNGNSVVYGIDFSITCYLKDENCKTCKVISYSSISSKMKPFVNWKREF